MKTHKMNRVFATMLSFAFIFAVMVSTATAANVNYAEDNSQKAELIIDPIRGEMVALPSEDAVIYQRSVENTENSSATTENAVISQQSVKDNEPSAAVAEALTKGGINTFTYPSTAPKCAMYSVYAYPLVLCPETGDRIYNTGIYARGLWPNLNTSGATIFVSTAEMANLNNRVLSYFQGLNDGKTYSLIGWQVVVTYKFSSPGTIKYQAYSPQCNCFQGNNEVSKSVTSGSSLQIGYSFAVNPTVTSYSYCGVSGGFFPYGAVDIMIGGGVGFNKN